MTTCTRGVFCTCTEETDKIDVLFEKYEAYCNPKQNVTVIRYKFNTRNQSDGETADQYVTELKRLAKDCGYGELTSEMIRDRIVCGTKFNNPQVKEKLLQADALDLTKALTIARGIEISNTQMKDLTEQNKAVHGMYKDKREKKQTRSEQTHDGKTRVSECRYCGGKHAKQECPARGKVCFKCKKHNHYARMCRSKSVHVCSRKLMNLNLRTMTFLLEQLIMRAETNY